MTALNRALKTAATDEFLVAKTTEKGAAVDRMGLGAEGTLVWFAPAQRGRALLEFVPAGIFNYDDGGYVTLDYVTGLDPMFLAVQDAASDGNFAEVSPVSKAYRLIEIGQVDFPSESKSTGVVSRLIESLTFHPSRVGLAETLLAQGYTVKVPS